MSRKNRRYKARVKRRQKLDKQRMKAELKLQKLEEKEERKRKKVMEKEERHRQKQEKREQKKGKKKPSVHERPVKSQAGKKPGSSTGSKKAVTQKKKQEEKRLSAQKTIAYREMGRDGICRVQDRTYSKTIRFYDINYQLAQNEDKNAIFENWCDFLNYFDSTIHFQLSFINHKSSMTEFEQVICIKPQHDAFDDVRMEYAQMLKNQLAKGNNGLVKSKYITFSIEADNIKEAKPKLERIEADILNNFKVLGVQAYPLNGTERLEILYETFNPDNQIPFRFDYNQIVKNGLGTKDFVAPTSFVFQSGKHFKMGDTMGAAGYVEACNLKLGAELIPEHEVKAVRFLCLDEPEPVYDLSVEGYQNFLLACGVIVHNSGKSFAAKREITNAFFATQDDIIIGDPEGEYYPLVHALGGQVIHISPTSKDYINPLDINMDYSDDDNPLGVKSDFVLSLCELIMGSRDGIEAEEKSVIDRCLPLVYQKYFEHPVPENMPVLGDLYHCLREQKEPQAQRIATALEIYVNGSLKVFNHQTNVELSNRIVCFDIKDLGKQLKKLGMLIVQDQVWNRVTINRSAHKSTRYYIDEFHLLLKEEQTAAYSVEIWKRFRKWGGIPTGITQNVKDLLSSREIENIFENSDFIYMLNQAAGDRQILAKQLNISPYQLSYVTNSGEGEGLLFYGSTIIPFKDKFDKSLKLYTLMTTKPSEMESMQCNRMEGEV